MQVINCLFLNHMFMLFYVMFYVTRVIHKETSTTPSCSGPIPAQKSWGNSVLGVIFFHTIPKMDVRYSHRFS